MSRLVVHMDEDDLRKLIAAAVAQALLDAGLNNATKPVKYLTRKQTAAMLHVSLGTINDWRKKNILVPQNIGGRTLYELSHIEKKLNNK